MQVPAAATIPRQFPRARLCAWLTPCFNGSRFEAERLPENSRIIERARHLGAYLQATRTEAEQARAGRHSTDQAVIAETAVLDFLYA